MGSEEQMVEWKQWIILGGAALVALLVIAGLISPEVRTYVKEAAGVCLGFVSTVVKF